MTDEDRSALSPRQLLERSALHQALTAGRAPLPAGLYAKLCDAAKAIGPVVKAGKNEAQGYNYAKVEDVVLAAREQLLSRGVVIMPSVVGTTLHPPSFGGKASFTVMLEIKYRLVDADTGETWESRWWGLGMDPGDKGLNKAYTAALKYFLIDLLQIPIGDDPEEDERMDHREARASRPGGPAASSRRPAAGRVPPAGAGAPANGGARETPEDAAKRAGRAFYAALREQGFGDNGDREGFGAAVKQHILEPALQRDVKSRTELSGPDWGLSRGYLLKHAAEMKKRAAFSKYLVDVSDGGGESADNGGGGYGA